MSKLMACENRTKEVLVNLKRDKTVMTHNKLEPYSPFSEFNNDTEGLHLGACSSLIHCLPLDKKVSICMVIISVIRPPNKEPFLVLFVTKNSNNECVFPITYSDKGKLDYSGKSFLKSFGVEYSIIGHFHDKDDSYFSVYEIEERLDIHNKLCDSSTVPGLWLTPNEIVTDSLIAPKISDRVLQFVTSKCQGVVRLYRNGKFIQPPRVFYTTQYDEYSKHLTIGDTTYAVISSFFDIPDNESQLRTKKVSRLIGTFTKVTRVVYWGSSDFTLCTLDNSKEKCNYIIIDVYRNECFFLSDHYGYLTSETQDAVTLVNQEMFIFE